MLLLLVVVDERHQVHVMVRGKQPQQVIGADPIAAIGRIRQPVREEQDPHYCRLRTTLAGMPAAITAASTGFVTTDPAPITLSGPISAITIAPLPTHEP